MCPYTVGAVGHRTRVTVQSNSIDVLRTEHRVQEASGACIGTPIHASRLSRAYGPLTGPKLVLRPQGLVYYTTAHLVPVRVYQCMHVRCGAQDIGRISTPWWYQSKDAR